MRGDNRPVTKGVILYKYYPADRADVLERRIIYFSHPSAFNDPFELAPYFRPSIPERLHKILKEDLNYPPRELPKHYEDMTVRSKLERAKLEDEHKHTLVFSMSEEADQFMKWAYYATGHSGFAIGFHSDHERLKNRLDGGSRRLQQVNYATLRPAVDRFDELREQEMLLTKSTHWMHEKEWRMFESPFNSDENHSVVPGVWGFRLEPATVNEVVLGARIVVSTEQRILTALSTPAFKHVLVRRIVLDEEQFRLNFAVIREGVASQD